MKTHLLPFHPEDLKAINLLEKVSFSEPNAISEQQLCAIILHSDVLCYCLKKEDGELIGYILLKIEKIKHSMVILSLAIQKKYQRASWGSRLLDICKKISQDLRLDNIKVQIDGENKKSKKFLEKAKFQISEKFTDYLTKGQKGIELVFFIEKHF